MHKINLLAVLPLFALAGSALEQPARSQAWQCTPPQYLPRPKLELPPKAEIRRSPVTGYVLTLSWSREYCRKNARKPDADLQCNGKIGDFGFVLHGLWPETKGPDYPQWCKPVGLLSAKLVSRHICMTPSVQLLQHEWAKHGSCMTGKAENYFASGKLLFDALEFPDMERLSRSATKIGDITSAFADINSGLPDDAIRVKTGRNDWLEEVRICLNKKFKPERCPKNSGGAKNKAPAKIWRGGKAGG